jgi:uncharacterized protein DUF402
MIASWDRLWGARSAACYVPSAVRSDYRGKSAAATWRSERPVGRNGARPRSDYNGAVDTVLVQKLKRPEGSGLWGAYVLDDDEYGHWLYSPVGCLYRGSRDGAVEYCHVGGPDLTHPGLAVVRLIPYSGWWTAAWARPLGRNRISVDVCTPPVRRNHNWSYIDLELDLVSDAPGQVEMWDEDEFVEACSSGWIASSEIAPARNAASKVEAMIRDRRGPFGQIGWRKLDSAISTNLSALADLPQ